MEEKEIESAGIYIEGVQGLTMAGNLVVGYKNGIVIKSSDDVQATGNTVADK